MVFIMSGKAQAVPMYYTFDGTVYNIIGTAPEIANDQGFFIGDSVTYTFIIDFDANAAITYNSGTVFTYLDTASTDYFYTDYVSGDALVEVDGGYYNQGYYPAEYKYGYDCLDRICRDLWANSTDDLLQINSNSAISDWVPGGDATMYGINWAYDSTSAYSLLYADLTLTSISPVNAVPEPSTLLLLGSGMLGLIAYRRRQLTTQT